MHDWRKAPIFGERPNAAPLIVRPCAYCLVENDRGDLAIVRVGPNVYLPGGGIEAGENPLQTVLRETVEECGLVVRVGLWTTAAIQVVFADSEGLYYEKRSVFVDAKVEAFDPGSKTEADHELEWVTPQIAAQLMSHDSQNWAIGKWLASQATPTRDRHAP